MIRVSDTNLHFHQELDLLEQDVMTLVSRLEQTVDVAVESLVTSSSELAEKVIDLGSEFEEAHFSIHQRWTNLMARQQPMGSDLRKLTVLLHLNQVFVRMSAQCVNIARVTLGTEGLPRVERMCEQIREMSDLVRPMIRTAQEAYVRQDLDEARLLPAMDEPVDRLYANMYEETVAVADNRPQLEWATKVLMVSRALERIGDQAVDFAEQTAYLITGEMASFDDSAFAGSVDGKGN